ncbi:MAG: diacylglycerol kinase [Micrococcales bacterium]|nr:MAG: diacylglycerol kinase [Micrococcales bacterium]
MNADPSDTFWVVMAAVLLCAAVVLAIVRRRRAALAPRVTDGPSVPAAGSSEPRRAAVVLNPTKFLDHGEKVRAEVTAASRARGWADPLWLTTTAEDPGGGQTTQALQTGVQLVMACGGDGTVRAVGAALSGSSVPLALLPAGTGNLLARNLDISWSDLSAAVRTAFEGADRAVDIGVVTLDDRPPQRFLVMAGMGFDADVMLSTSEQLKSVVGPVAYVVAGVRKLNGEHTKVSIRVDDHQPVERGVRAVLVGNCGKLVGGMALIPRARIDDGVLDTLTVAPRGIVGWANVAAAVVTRSRRGHHTMEYDRGRQVVVVAAEPMPTQLDGDGAQQARVLRASIEPGALLVRVGRPA